MTSISKKIMPLDYPYPYGYDHNAKCGFHDGSSGNITEYCTAFKFKVKELIDRKLSMFKKNGSMMDILINKPCEFQSKESPIPMVFSYSMENGE